MIAKLSMVTLVVEDQDEAVEFYTEKLGFDVTRDHPGPHGRFVAVAPDGHENTELVFVSPDGFGDDTRDLEKEIGTDKGTVYLVDDCRATYEELGERGVEFKYEPERMDWGVQTIAIDMDGNELVLREPPKGR